MRRLIFVTGTDTGVGKTTVLCALVRQLRCRGISAAAVKPVESGCLRNPDGSLHPADAVRLADASGTPLEETILYRLETGVAPQVAAGLENLSIDWTALVRWIREREGSPLFVEGAGGPLVPIFGGKTFADLAEDVGAECVVVVGSKLGCLNHAALTFELLRARGIPLLGYVLNDLHRAPDSTDPALSTNRGALASIAERYRVLEIGYVPRGRENEDGIQEDAEFILDPFASALQAVA